MPKRFFHFVQKMNKVPQKIWDDDFMFGGKHAIKNEKLKI
jgi:hypothetical protein